MDWRIWIEEYIESKNIFYSKMGFYWRIYIEGYIEVYNIEVYNIEVYNIEVYVLKDMY